MRSLKIDSQVNLLAFLQPHGVYVGDNYRDVKHRDKASTPFSEYLELNQVNMVWVSDRLTGSPGYVDDSEFSDFVRDPDARGFRRVAIPGAESWLLVEKGLK